jgi:hypothetical protein
MEAATDVGSSGRPEERDQGGRVLGSAIAGIGPLGPAEPSKIHQTIVKVVYNITN